MALGKLAEGEELGSNLLRVAHSSPVYPAISEKAAWGKRADRKREDRGRIGRESTGSLNRHPLVLFS